MNPNLHRLRAWLWWLIPFAALALLLGIETDWGRGRRWQHPNIPMSMFYRCRRQ